MLIQKALTRLASGKAGILRTRGDCGPGEFIARLLFPVDYAHDVSLESIEHQSLPFTGMLFDASVGKPHQRGLIEGFITDDCVVWPAVAAVRTSRGMLIRQSFFDDQAMETARNLRALGRFPVVSCDDPCASLGHINRGFYHLLADSIPKIFALQHPVLRGMPRVRLFLDSRFNAGQLSLIRALIPSNVELAEVPFVSRVAARRYVHLPYLSARRVEVTPAWARESLGYAPKEYLTWFRDNAFDVFRVRAPLRATRKIYVSRGAASVRRIQNESLLSEALGRLGFETVRLEGLGLDEQAALFASASCVVAQHGAGLTNVVYMSPGSKVVEIMSSANKLRHFRILAESLDVQHAYVTTEGRRKNEDVIADGKLVADVLAAITDEAPE